MLRGFFGFDESVSGQWSHHFFPVRFSKILRTFGAVLMVFLAFESLLWAQASENRIQRIEIEGNHHIERQAILGKLSIQSGDLFSTEQVRQQIQKIYSMGFFEEVDVTTQLDANGVDVVFRVKEKPFTVEVVYDGNDELSDGVSSF